jgi:hypothetical protein
MKKIILDTEVIGNIVSDYIKGDSIPKLSVKYAVNTRKISDTLKDNKIEVRGRRKFYYNESFFEKIDSNLKAYWLGFLFADGCVRNIKSGYVLKIKLSNLDENHLFAFLNHIGSNQKELRTETSKFIGKNGKNYQSTCKVLLINSKKIVEDLIKLGCGQNKTNSIIFPIINDNLIPSFILGYFDGDGCITQKKVKGHTYYSVTFTSGSENFLDRTKKELLDIGLNSISKYKYNTFFRLQICNKIDLLKIKDYFYSTNNFYLERKKIKFDNL